MLNESVIRQELISAVFNKPIHFHLLDTVDSTNQFLKNMPSSHALEVCCAEEQTQGRGRFGRSWHSPCGENIYCSIRWHLDCGLARLSGLSLVVSMAVLEALKDMSIDDDIRIKWPNDILWHGKKLCGNLVELITDSSGHTEVVIGIGINVNSATQDQNLFDKPWCSLYEITGNHFDRNLLIARLLIQLNQNLQQLISQGFSSFIPIWQRVDNLYGQQVTVSQLGGTLSGQANGVNESGQLILIDAGGITHYLSAGDTSFKL